MFNLGSPCPFPPSSESEVAARVEYARWCALNNARDARIHRYIVLALAALTLLVVCTASVFAQGLLPDGAKDFFSLLVAWPRTKIEYIFLAAAWCGVLAHWWNKHRLGEVAGNFIDYLLADRRAFAFSAATAIVIYAAIMGLIMTGLVAIASWPGALAGGLTIGWVIDSLLTPKAA